MKTLTNSTIARLNAQAKLLIDSTAIPDPVEAHVFVAARVGLRRWASESDAILYKGRGLYGGLVNLWIDPSERVRFDNQVEWHCFPQFPKPDYVK